MSQRISVRCLVSGKVQGVWYRAATKEQAAQLGITGYARNLPDGRVEVVASGEKTQITLLFEWMKRGPRLAEVTAVTYEELPWQQFDKFDTR